MMDALLNVIAAYADATLFGAMVFFAAGVAPVVFKALDPEAGGKFLRAVFPAYYLVVILSSGLAALVHYDQRVAAAAYAAVCVSTIWVRQSLVPAINRWRDAELAGDAAAAAKFNAGHRLSVIINVVQMITVAVVIAAGAL
jgi:hypothetical protein